MVLKIEHFCISNDLNILPMDLQSVFSFYYFSFFFFFYAFPLRHSMHSTVMLLSIFQPRFHHEI